MKDYDVEAAVLTPEWRAYWADLNAQFYAQDWDEAIIENEEFDDRYDYLDYRWDCEESWRAIIGSFLLSRGITRRKKR